MARRLSLLFVAAIAIAASTAIASLSIDDMYIDDAGAGDSLTTIRDVLRRMLINTNTEEKAANHELNNLELFCKQNIDKYSSDIKQLETEHKAALATGQERQKHLDELQSELDQLNLYIAAKQKEVQNIREAIAKGDKERKETLDEYHHKHNQTLQVLEALGLVQGRLTTIRKDTFGLQNTNDFSVDDSFPTLPSASAAQHNAAAHKTFSFREMLQNAASLTADASIQSMIQSALAGVTEGPVTSKDVTNLHALLTLLINDLQDYRDEQRKNENMAEALWVEHRRELAEELAIFENDLHEKLQVQTVKRGKVLTVESAARAAADLESYVPQLIKVNEAERLTLTNKCLYDTHNLQNEISSLKKQAASIDAILQLANADSSVATKIEDDIPAVELTPVTLRGGKRCCKICPPKMQACGNECISIGHDCKAKHSCACDDTTI